MLHGGAVHALSGHVVWLAVSLLLLLLVLLLVLLVVLVVLA